MNLSQKRWPFIFAGVIGALAITLGAFGAHGLAPLLDETGRTETWKTGAIYHLVHAVALLAGALLHAVVPAATPVLWAIRFWTAGTVVFSGSLYLLSVGGPGWLGAITPLGGLMFIAGWISVCFVRPQHLFYAVSGKNMTDQTH